MFIEIKCKGCKKTYINQDWRKSIYCSKVCAGKNNFNSGRFVTGYTYEEQFGERANEFRERCSRIANKIGLGKIERKNYSHSDETKRKMSIAAKKRKLSNEQLYRLQTVNIGRKLSKEHKEKISKFMKLRMSNPEMVKKCLRRRTMSSLELKMQEILFDNNLPYKFVGNGQVIIGGKCPDFVNTNGEKIAVEVYYKKHKEQFRNGVEEWKRKRMETFAEYGWKLKFFDAMEVNKETIKTHLGGD